MSDRAPEPATPPPTPVSYETRPTVVTIRGFRLLLALTLLNTMLLGAYVLGPGIYKFAVDRWQGFQRDRAAKQAAVANAAKRTSAMKVEAEALAYVAPPKTLVYDDDTRPTPTPATAPWPAATTQPTQFLALPRSVGGWGILQFPSYTVLFMHERRSSAGATPRLILVVLDPQNLPSQQSRKFLAITFHPTTANSNLTSTAY